MVRLSTVFSPFLLVYFHSRPGTITSARLDVSSSGDKAGQVGVRMRITVSSLIFEGYQ